MMMNQQQEIILRWLLECRLRPEAKAETPLQIKMVKLCTSQTDLWIKEIDQALENYIENKNTIKGLEKFLTDLGVPKPVSEDSKTEASTLLSIIKDFISMLSGNSATLDCV
jgi:hypothetical protein